MVMEKTRLMTGAILVVDDEESLRLTFQLFLQREGYDPVFTASTFEDALELVRQKEFDLIISDIVLEGRSGIDLLKCIRETGNECPVVMVTGYPNVKTASEAVRLGAFDYLPKPVNKEALLKVTRLALQQYHLMEEKKKSDIENARYRRYMEAVFRSVKDGIITVDTDMKIVELNQAARFILKELVPERSNTIPEEDFSSSQDKYSSRLGLFKNEIEQAIADRKYVPEHRIECENVNGRHKVFSISASPLDDGSGLFSGAVLVVRDMTRIEELEHRGTRTRFHRFIGGSPAMQVVYTLIENVGKVDTAVLITGESGTGKELVAEALHEESPRKNSPLVKVDCTAIPEDLLESELFGHKKGAFTGADRDRMGRILQADGGTLFLDEIGDISPRMQVRLLRFLQEKTFYPVGRDQPIQVDVRVIAATNANLKEKVRDGKFREDLYFRLRVIDVMLPPLRNREGDVRLLAKFFVERFAAKLDKTITGISDQAVEILERHRWPGNVRELEHVMERACVLCNASTISTSHLPEDIINSDISDQGMEKNLETVKKESKETETVVHEFDVIKKAPSVDDIENLPEDQRIVAALIRSGGNKAKAARLLGIDRSTIYRKIREFDIDADAITL